MKPKTESELAIWKYPISDSDVQVVKIPAAYEILTVQIHQGVPCLWALVDPSQEGKPVGIEVFGTGQPIPPGNRKYIGTFQAPGGALGFHVFESSDLID
jgi:hypothetical protein